MRQRDLLSKIFWPDYLEIIDRTSDSFFVGSTLTREPGGPILRPKQAWWRRRPFEQRKKLRRVLFGRINLSNGRAFATALTGWRNVTGFWKVA